jgi:hypothetical protein
MPAGLAKEAALMEELMKIFVIVYLSVFALSCWAEETASFTLASGVTLVEKATVSNGVEGSLILNKTKDGYEVLVHAYMPCQGDFAIP